MTTTTPNLVCISSVIIDDIVFPDGKTEMAVLGGGGTHAAAGMAIWEDHKPGFISIVGKDCPQPILDRLNRDYDTRGIEFTDSSQARAWQIFEWNGKRTEVSRIDDWDLFLRTPTPQSAPELYKGTKGVYILRDATQFHAWRKIYPDAAMFWEPEQRYMHAGNKDEFRDTLQYTSIVSPNGLEAAELYGFSDPQQLVRTMIADGANIVALRMGEKGSLVGARHTDQLHYIPAVPIDPIIDQTGAGNTYCGGFLAGWVQTNDIRLAGCYGAVAASFALENLGVLELTRPDLREQRQKRLEWIQNHCEIWA